MQSLHVKHYNSGQTGHTLRTVGAWRLAEQSHDCSWDRNHQWSASRNWRDSPHTTRRKRWCCHIADGGRVCAVFGFTRPSDWRPFFSPELLGLRYDRLVDLTNYGWRGRPVWGRRHIRTARGARYNRWMPRCRRTPDPTRNFAFSVWHQNPMWLVSPPHYTR